MPSRSLLQDSPKPARVTVELTTMPALRQRLAMVPPTDAQLLADGREHARRALSEAQPPVEDVRNALAMLALATSGRTETGGLIFGFSHADLEAVERLLRAAVVKLDAMRAAPTFTESDVSLLGDIAGGFSTVLHYDRLDEFRKRVAAHVRGGAR